MHFGRWLWKSVAMEILSDANGEMAGFISPRLRQTDVATATPAPDVPTHLQKEKKRVEYTHSLFLNPFSR